MSYRYVELSGSRIAYRVHGSGPAIVLMKNNRRPLDYPIVEQLSQQFRVLQLHPIGFGASDRPDDFDFGRRPGDPATAAHQAGGRGDRLHLLGVRRTGPQRVWVGRRVG
jgi:hypothetical protein